MFSLVQIVLHKLNSKISNFALTLLQLLLVLSVAIACKKEQPKPLDNDKEILQTEKNLNQNPTDNLTIHEISTADFAAKLKSQSSDTLFIYNFFATWCAPCIREIPDFRQKMEETQNLPIQFVFVNLDNKQIWETKVSAFTKEFDISENTVFLDGTTITPEFFQQNFPTWDGQYIPFTFLKKGKQSVEINQSISKQILDENISKFGL